MSNSVFGNTAQPEEFITEWETEVDEDEYEDLWGEYVFDSFITGFRAICPKNSQTTTVSFKYYYYFFDYFFSIFIKFFIIIM